MDLVLPRFDRTRVVRMFIVKKTTCFDHPDFFYYSYSHYMGVYYDLQSPAPPSSVLFFNPLARAHSTM